MEKFIAKRSTAMREDEIQQLIDDDEMPYLVD